MKKVNFGAIPVKDIEGNVIPVDVRKPLGNALYMQGQDIVECETGSKIYHSDGEIELDEKQVEAVRKFIGGYPFVTRNAIENAMSEG